MLKNLRQKSKVSRPQIGTKLRNVGKHRYVMRMRKASMVKHTEERQVLTRSSMR